MKRVYVPKIKLFLTIVLGALVLVFLMKAIFLGRNFMRETGLTPVTFVHLVFGGGAPLKELGKRTNVLLLGISGGTHMGADLTDTIIVLSIETGKPSVALISIPRDVWSDSLKDKVNSAYHYGEEKKKGGGLTLAKAIIEDVIGLPIQYSGVIDFSGFTDVIDLVGGVTVNVPKSFTDPEFPIEGKENDECGGDPKFKCRYEVIHFDAGPQLMDGNRALDYVRSRQAEGEEGSDFARSRRQQEVLVDLKEKLTSPKVWLSPKRALALVQALNKATDSDMNIGEFLTVGKAIATIQPDQIQRVSIENLLTPPPLIWYGRYVLIPKESFAVIHDYLKEQLK